MVKKYDTRKCHECSQEIKFEKKNITGIIYYKNYYYHLDCFCKLAEKKSNSARGKPQEWKDALDNIDELEGKTKELLGNRIVHRGVTDDLNDYLLSVYDVVEIPGRFWQVVGDLSNGIYKHRRCKKVPTETLLNAWKWAQHKLDDVAQYNKSNHKGPVDDAQRIPYDLAIVVRNVPNYLAYKAKQEAAEAERERELKENVKIDYSKITNNTQRKDNNNFQDISSLVDDLF